jgi:hypothetical protein
VRAASPDTPLSMRRSSPVPPSGVSVGKGKDPPISRHYIKMKRTTVVGVHNRSGQAKSQFDVDQDESALGGAARTFLPFRSQPANDGSIASQPHY